MFIARRVPGYGLSRLHPLSRSPLTNMRRASTQVGWLATPSDANATAQMWALRMEDFKTEREHFHAEREWFESEREQFHHCDKMQAIRIVEMKKDAMHMLDDRLRCGEGFNVRGGLQRICYHAVLENRIQNIGGVQRQLDALATTNDFGSIYRHEIAARKLTMKEVERDRRNIYHELSKHAHGNERTILIRRMDFTPNEVAAVVSYYKMQDAWADALAWLEVGGK